MQIVSSLLVCFALCVPAATASATQLTSSANMHKTTFVVIYRPGPAWLKGKPVSQQPLKEHWKYMLSLFASGSMSSAGPLTDDSGGLVVLETLTQAEAIAIVEHDPAVKAGIFVQEIHPWAPVQWQKFLKQ